ncbi:MAG: phosphoribosylglycinamide formyltransferase [Pseudomonadales bacterium]
MNSTAKQFVFVVSTQGSVMDATLESAFLRGKVHSVVADRECGAIQKARDRGVPIVLFDEPEAEAFSQKLSIYMAEHGLEWVISFYTNFYSEAFRVEYCDRIINFHPSLLPAFKGMDGFGDGIAYHVKLIGTTVELIKDVMDEGKIVLQTVTPVDPDSRAEQLRHRIFVQQCKSLIQVVKWISENRLTVNGDVVTIERATFGDLEFSPALDFKEAQNLNVPLLSHAH